MKFLLKILSILSIIAFFRPPVSGEELTQTIKIHSTYLGINMSALNMHDNNSRLYLDKAIKTILIKNTSRLKIKPLVIDNLILSKWYKRKNRVVLRYDSLVYDDELRTYIKMVDNNLIVVIQDDKIEYLISSIPVFNNKPFTEFKLNSHLSIQDKEKLLYQIVYTHPKALKQWVINTNKKIVFQDNSQLISDHEIIKYILSDSNVFNKLLRTSAINKPMQLHFGAHPYVVLYNPFDLDRELFISLESNDLIDLPKYPYYEPEISVYGPKSRDELETLVIKSTTSANSQNVTTVQSSKSIYRDVQANLLQIMNQINIIFELNSFDNEGTPLTAVVNHPGMDIIGSAKWVNTSKELWIGRPSSKFHNIGLSLEILGHEIFHGVESSISQLNSFGESGALREHLSDVIGLMLKQLISPRKEPLFVIGSDVLKEESIEIFQQTNNTSITPSGLRDLLNPQFSFLKQGHNMEEMRSKYSGNCLNEEMDFCGVHEQAAIPNQVFAKFVQYLINDRKIDSNDAFINTSYLIFDTFAFRLVENTNFQDYKKHLINECSYKVKDNFFTPTDCEQINKISLSLGL